MEWLETLPENVRSWDEAKNSDSPEKFWKQIEDHRSLLGRSIRIPTSEAGDEDRKAFTEKVLKHAPELMMAPDASSEDAIANIFSTLGHPEKADDYEMPEFDASKVNKDTIESLRDYAHKNKLTKSQFKGLIQDVIEESANQAETIQASRTKAIEGLKKEWGSAYDERVVEISTFAEKTSAPEEFRQALLKGNADPSVMKWLHSLVKAVEPENVNIADQHKRTSTLTPSEAQAQIDDIMNNPQHAFNDAKHPRHRAAMEEMIKLRTLVSPEKAKTFGGRPI